MQPFTVGGCPPLSHFYSLTSSELLYRHAASHLTESCVEFLCYKLLTTALSSVVFVGKAMPK